MTSRAPATALLATILLLTAACSDSADDAGTAATEPTTVLADGAAPPAAGAAAARAALEEGRTVLDVRTPEEFAEGHVEGAVLVDIMDPSFEDEIAALDPAVPYVVYCRSGNRSATAAAQMQDLGLDVYDGGGLDTMVAAGWPEG